MMLYRYALYKSIDKFVKVLEYDFLKLESITTMNLVKINIDIDKDEEALFFTLQGRASAGGSILNTRDMYYISPDSKIELEIYPDTVAYLVRSWASTKYNSYIKRFSEGKRIRTGVMPYTRTVITMIGEDDPANSIIAGYVEGDVGNWTSYPPHKHDEKPEIYIFYGINPGFAVQLLLKDNSEEAYVVHDFDVVLIDKGYHPNVPSTINPVNFAWIIAAPEGKRDLQVDYHPIYKDLPKGPQVHIKARS
ncbi:MAG: 5-deoxy-glucuronate isomerase [Infirmifilum sp.]